MADLWSIVPDRAQAILTLAARNQWLVNVLLTVGILVGVFALRRVLIISKSSAESTRLEERRARLVRIRNGLGMIAAILILIVWGTELKTLTVSLVAIAAAVVLATKELIMSAIGGIVRTVTQKYRVGDRIWVKDFAGDVVDVTLLNTTLMEVSSVPGVQMYTGRMTSFPHSYLLTETFRKQSMHAAYRPHIFSIPIPSHHAQLLAKDTMQATAVEHCAEHIEQASIEFQRMQHHQALDMPSTEPRVLMHADQSARWWLTVRIVVPGKLCQALEQKILHDYLEKMPVSPKLGVKEHEDSEGREDGRD